MFLLLVACSGPAEPGDDTQAAELTPRSTDGLERFTMDDAETLLYVLLTAPEDSLGHSHVVRASGVEGTVDVDSADPSTLAVTVAFSALDLVVDEGELRLAVGLDDTLSEGNRETIREHMLADDQLDAERTPEISFTSTQASGSLDAVALTGEMTLRGQSVEMTLPLKVVVAEEGVFLSGESTLTGSDFGLEPYAVGPFKNPDEMALVIDARAE